MTDNVFGGTLKLTRLQLQLSDSACLQHKQSKLTIAKCASEPQLIINNMINVIKTISHSTALIVCHIRRCSAVLVYRDSVSALCDDYYYRCACYYYRTCLLLI